MANPSLRHNGDNVIFPLSNVHDANVEKKGIRLMHVKMQNRQIILDEIFFV